MPRCTGNESLAEGYSQEPKLGLVVRAVYAMAHALRDMRAALCPTTRRGLCPAILPFNVSSFKVYHKHRSSPIKAHLSIRLLLECSFKWP